MIVTVHLADVGPLRAQRLLYHRLALTLSRLRALRIRPFLKASKPAERDAIGNPAVVAVTGPGGSGAAGRGRHRLNGAPSPTPSQAFP